MSITGGDEQQFEQKFMHPEGGVSQLRFVFGTNYPLAFSNQESDSAMWARPHHARKENAQSTFIGVRWREDTAC